MCAKCLVAERRPNDSYCRDCRREYQREWARANPEKTKRYRDNLQRRIKAGTHTPGESGPGKPGRPKAEQGDGLREAEPTAEWFRARIEEITQRAQWPHSAGADVPTDLSGPTTEAADYLAAAVNYVRDHALAAPSVPARQVDE